MALMRKPYLHSPKPGYWYVRMGGRYVGRITAPVGSQEFDDQYWALRSGKAKAAKTSWAALIKSYRASARWARLKPRTRQYYERVLEYFEEANAAKDVRELRRKDVIAGQEANRHRVRFANAIPAVLSVLCEHAIDLGWLKDNPAKGVRKIATPEDKRKPHIPWTDAAVAKWRAEAAPLPLLIFELGVGTVQRPGDLVAFKWGDYDGMSLSLVQGKTGKVLRSLPCTPQLKAALDRAKQAVGGAPHPARAIICGARGHALTYSGMSQVMRKERKRLGIREHDLHALRYRGVMELAWAGCTDEEIASFSGHDTIEMIRKYAGEARQTMRARQAAEKRK